MIKHYSNQIVFRAYYLFYCLNHKKPKVAIAQMPKLKEKIYCIGDSHVVLFSKRDKLLPIWDFNNRCYRENENFIVYQIGPALAYNLMRQDTKTKSKEKIECILREIPKGSKIILSFGEIDCRVHLSKRILKEPSKEKQQQIIYSCAERYMEFIKSLKKDYNPIVFGVPPSNNFPFKDRQYPHLGSGIFRNKITKEFNEYLERNLSKFNVPVVSLYDYLVDKKGQTLVHYQIDGVHLSQRAVPFLIKELEKMGLFRECCNG